MLALPFILRVDGATNFATLIFSFGYHDRENSAKTEEMCVCFAECLPSDVWYVKLKMAADTLIMLRRG